MNYIEHFSNHFDESDVEYFVDNGVEYFEAVPPPEFDGCIRITSGDLYDKLCKNKDMDVDSSKNCLMYACPNVNLTDNVWNQRKAALGQYFGNVGCDGNKIFTGPNMVYNGRRLYNGFCSLSNVDTGNGLPP